MAGEINHFHRNRSSTIIDEDYARDQIDVSDLPPTSWVRIDWYPIPRVPSGGKPPSVTQGFTPSPASQVLNPGITLLPAAAGFEYARGRLVDAGYSQSISLIYE
jgi:hypothetical protein